MVWAVTAVCVVLYFGLIAARFATKLNRSQAVETSGSAPDTIEAIDFYWRPG